MTKRKVQKARPGVAGLLREVKRYCEANDVPVAQLVYETGYTNAHRLLSDDQPVYVQVETEKMLREWLHSRKHQDNAPAADDNDKLMLEVEILEQDEELALIYALCQVTDYFSELTDVAKTRALKLVICRIR